MREKEREGEEETVWKIHVISWKQENENLKRTGDHHPSRCLFRSTYSHIHLVPTKYNLSSDAKPFALF